MSGNVTPAKRGSEAENNMIQPEKQPKLATHEKPPIETSQQLIDVPGKEVEQAKAVRDDGYCRIHKCNMDHNTFTCPDREKYLILRNGVYVLDPCDICDFDHLGAECPHDADDFNYDEEIY